MPRPTRPGLALPRSPRRYRFSLTPLADMMFQLLVFFMLSANVAPYAMLTVQSGAVTGGTEAGASAAPAGRATPARSTAIWTLEPTRITAGGQRFDLARLPDLAEALRAQGTRNLLLILRPEVEMQVVVGVLDLLAGRGITAVQLADGGAVAGGPP